MADQFELAGAVFSYRTARGEIGSTGCYGQPKKRAELCARKIDEASFGIS
jgi:hypothetical protein